MRRKRKVGPGTVVRPPARLYTLEVLLIGGPITKQFAKKNRVVSRTIQIRGDQTLQDLHRAIFSAFNRFEEHFYEFQVGGKGPMDPKARRYVLPQAMEGLFAEENPAGLVTRTTIEALRLRKGDAFGYWFDFGDDWWHQVNVAEIADTAPAGRYPRVIARVGDSPPQYGE
jgi:hypothetical protein